MPDFTACQRHARCRDMMILPPPLIAPPYDFSLRHAAAAEALYATLWLYAAMLMNIHTRVTAARMRFARERYAH